MYLKLERHNRRYFIIVHLLLYAQGIGLPLSFFDSVQQGAVFNEENSQRLSRMDGYCTAIPFLLFGFNTINYLREVSSPGIQVSNIIKHVDFEIWLLIFGLTLLTIAFVFKKGIALTQ